MEHMLKNALLGHSVLLCPGITLGVLQETSVVRGESVLWETCQGRVQGMLLHGQWLEMLWE